MPAVVRALGSRSKKLTGRLAEKTGIPDGKRTLQKSTLLGSANILRKVLGT